MMTIIKLNAISLIFVAVLTLVSATQLPNFPVAKPDCDDRCGNISIPFPFGTTESCYRNYSFWVTCNMTSFTQPKLFKKNSTIEIANISLQGQLTVMNYVVKNCYSKNGTLVSHNNPFIQLSIPFTVNNTANKFTILGCDTYGFIYGRRGNTNRSYSTGCTSTCQGMDDLSDGSCEGLGCCQITRIPKNVRRVALLLRSYKNHTDVWEFNKCSYGFFVEENAFKFSPENFTNMEHVKKLPMVADWVIGNETCESARMNSSSYACVSPNSICYEPENGHGYRCQCENGYQGNPYLVDGCQDINECHIMELNNCTYKDQCENSEGSFNCSCPKGYQGSGIGEGGCTSIPLESHTFIHESRTSIHVAGSVLGIILVMLVLCLLYTELKRRKSKKRKDMLFLQNGGKLLREKLKAAGRRETSPDDDPIAKIYNSKDLEIATNNFNRNMIVGQGGFGTVYKGIFEDKRIVAIKKSNKVDPTQIEQFINEFFVLSRISHRNVVKLLGCCLETEVPLLVYEFINNGTLYDHIHNQTMKYLLDWKLRLKIATETADVLWYLHSAAASTPIVHRDVKSANILLDNDFKAKVSDFGGSRLVPVDHTQLPTVVLGTRGYLDPEYMQTEELTEKSDVYSFGVVLVELITGRKAIDYDKPDKEKCLANFFKCKLKEGRLVDVLDETIVWDDISEKQVIGVAKIAQLCLNVRGEDRPTMKEVAVELEGLKTGKKQRSWANLEHISEEFGSSSGKGFDGFVDVDGYNTSVSYDSIRNDSVLLGGR